MIQSHRPVIGLPWKDSSFPDDQAYLWLPDFCGEARSPRAFEYQRSLLFAKSGKRNNASNPPCRVVSGTRISGDTGGSPSYSCQSLPVAHPLSVSELEDLGRCVIELLDDEDVKNSDPLTVLRCEYKTFVIAALGRMGLLPAPRSDSYPPPEIDGGIHGEGERATGSE